MMPAEECQRLPLPACLVGLGACQWPSRPGQLILTRPLARPDISLVHLLSIESGTLQFP